MSLWSCVVLWVGTWCAMEPATIKEWYCGSMSCRLGAVHESVTLCVKLVGVESIDRCGHGSGVLLGIRSYLLGLLGYTHADVYTCMFILLNKL